MIPKEKLHREFKLKREVGGPGFYHKDASWSATVDQFKRGAPRKFVFHDEVAEAKVKPTINDYDPIIKRNIPFVV
jgi:hypothetical protein